MTSRLIAGFMTVLVALLAAVVIPLGVIVTRQQTRDYIDQTGRVAQTIAAVAEEHLDDHSSPSSLRTVLGRFAEAGYSGAVVDKLGNLVASSGPVPSPAVMRAARAGSPLPQSDDAVTVSAPVADGTAALGVAIFTRKTTALESDHRTLWGLLVAAAGGAIAVGAAIAWSISRWITRPIHRLAHATHSIARGAEHESERLSPAIRADEAAGPPEVRQLAAAYNTMTDRVTALLAAQRNMTADVTHQLRTPLAALRLKLELHRDLPTAARNADIAAMIDETNRLAGLLDGLLAIARAEATTPEPVRTDLAAAVIRRVEVWRPVAEDEGLDLRADVSPAIAEITPNHLEQVLDNLIANAIDATPPGGRISVAAATAPTGPMVAVADTGPGMTPEQRDHALRRWSSTSPDDAHADRGGTGLGLTIARRLVEADHGTFTLDRTPGGGLTATIRYPTEHPHIRRTAEAERPPTDDGRRSVRVTR